MGSCYVMTKEDFIISMEKNIKKDQMVIFSTIKQGIMRGASKKKLKGFEIGFTNDCFKDSETITDLMNSFTGGLILIDKKYMPKETVEREVKK